MKEITDRLDTLIAEVRALRAAVENGAPRRRVDPDELHVALAAAIHAATAGTIFTARELAAHASLDAQEALRAAIVAVCGTLAARRIGKAARRLESAGLLERVGADGSGVLWVSRTIETPRNPHRRLAIA